MAFRIIPPDAFRRMPWKNGGGETIEILAFPEGADLAHFAWRISMAKVAGDGPFSRFEGIDRTLTVLDGGRLGLAFPDRMIMLDPASDPFVFSGDEACQGTIPDGSIIDLNVMTRRGQCRHAVTRLTNGQKRTSSATTAMAFAHQGPASLAIAGHVVGLAPGHAALVTGGEPVTYHAELGGTLFVIEIAPW
jgi:environmental stress-induced protein Ves